MDINANKKFNKLEIIKFDHYGKYGEKYYLFKCDCGNIKVINYQNVKSGKTKSCGCNYKGINKKKNKYEIKENYVVGYTTNTNQKFYIDKEDFEKIKNISWYEMKNGYICHKEKNKKVILMHRYIINPSNDKIVDHINHNKKDNRKNNLRITNYSINGLNRKKIPKGISKHRVGNNNYYSVQLKGYRGSFKNYDEAKKMRDEIIEREYKILK